MRIGESGSATAACVAAGVWVGASVGLGAVAQEAYFSIEGQVIAAGGTHQLFFDLDRPVESSENLLFQNFTHSGGVNAAGDAITASGFDSVLDLFNAGGGGIVAQNDDGGAGRDPLLSWAGVAPGGGGVLSPDPLPALADYRLTISDFGSNNTGPWAVDLVGPADGLTLSNLVPATATPSGVSQVDSVKFGTRLGVPGSLGMAPATWNHASGGLIEITDQLVVANTGHANLSVSDGQVSVENLTTIRAGGQIDLIGSEMFTDVQINALGGINLELDETSASTPRDSTLNVLSRAATVTAGDINIGTSVTGAGAATINLDGLTYRTTQINQSDGSTLTIGNNSDAGSATLNAINRAVYNTGTGLTTVNATGTLNGNVEVVVRGDLLVDGGVVNRIGTVEGQLTVRSGGEFDSGSVSARIRPDGLLVESGGSATFNAFLADTATAPYRVEGVDTFYYADSTDLSGDATFTVSNSARFVSDSFMLSGYAFALDSPNDDVAFRLESGATAFASTVRIAGSPTSGTASLTVTGAGTVFNQTNGGPNIGKATGGTGTLTVADGGVYNTNSFNNVNATGILNVAGGTFNATGAVNIKGGAVNLTSGKLTADTVEITNNGTFNFTGGTLEVATFDGSLSQWGGTFDLPTASAASTVTGDYDIQDATLAMFATLGSGPALTVDGLAMFGPGSTLQVDLDPNGTDLGANDSVVLVQSTGGIIGTFENEIITSPAGLLYEIVYTTNTIRLDAITAMLAGDYNGNGTVDAADYTIWADNFGSMINLAADGNGNGVVDAADYTVWQDNFGNTLAGASLPAIPEPASLTLLAGGLVLMIRRR